MHFRKQSKLNLEFEGKEEGWKGRKEQTANSLSIKLAEYAAEYRSKDEDAYKKEKKPHRKAVTYNLFHVHFCKREFTGSKHGKRQRILNNKN